MTRVLFWDVDTQHDFMKADGKLYVPGSEEIIPALKRLTDYAHANGVRILASSDDHVPGHRELSDKPDWHVTFPEHCMRGTPGQRKIPETALKDPLVIEPERQDPAEIKERVRRHQGDLLLHKHWFDVFTNENIGPVLDALEPERVVLYGVALDVCDRYAVEGLLTHRPGVEVCLVTDAVRAIHAEDGERLLAEWAGRGVRMVTVADVVGGAALVRAHHGAPDRAPDHAHDRAPDGAAAGAQRAQGLAPLRHGAVGAQGIAPLPAFGRFFLPGPTDVHPEVLQAMLRPMIAHRGPEMRAMLQRMAAPLQRLFRTERPILMSTSSATGFMEGAIRSGVRKKVLVVDGGFFGDRFAQISQRNGKKVVRLPVRAGRTVEAEDLDRWLTKRKGVDAVALVHCETSTGALAPLEELAKVVRAREDLLLLVDAVTSVGGSPVETDAWGLDFVFTGSQKALAMPPGIALAAASERMMERAKGQKEPGWYFDLVLHEEAISEHQPTQTPCLPLYFALEAQLRRIEAEGGVEARWERHRAMLALMERWVEAHPKWRFFAPEGRRSWTVSALKPPKGKTGPDIVAEVARHGYTIGAGLDELADAMVRIGHMGDLTPEHLEGLLGVIQQ